MPTERNPWDRRPEETPPAWQAFQMYRDLGLDRSQAEVGKQVGKNLNLMSRWSARHEWVTRAASWDNHLDEQRQQAAEEAMIEMGRRHADIGAAALNLVAQRLVGDDVGKIKQIDANTLTPQDIARFAATFAPLEREALGGSATSEYAEVAAHETETLIDMDDADEVEKVIALAEWVGGKAAVDNGG